MGCVCGPRIVFTSGATDAINLVAESWGSQNLGPGDEVLITAGGQVVKTVAPSCSVSSLLNGA